MSDETAMRIEATRTIDERDPFAWESQITLGGCKRELLDDPDVIRAAVVELCDTIKMTRYGEPILDFFGEGDRAGWTIIQRITESTIVIHCAPGQRWRNAVVANVCSCKQFAAWGAATVLMRCFKATSGVVNYKARPAPLEPGLRWE